MKIEFADRVWELDTEHVSFRHALAIQAQTGMSIADWEDSLDFQKDGDGGIRNPPPEWLTSVGALYWLMCAQNGEVLDPGEMEFDFTGFLQAYFAALAAEIARRKAEEKPEPDPTSPSGAAPSRAPGSRTATTRTRRARPEGGAIGS